MILAVKNLKLQGDIDADGWTINGLDLAGLNLSKNDVGLGNVDNTSDANKPVSSAMATALALKEDDIAAGTTAQYWRGDKTWQTLGALGLQGGATTLQELSSITLNATGSAFVFAKRNDYASSFAGTYIQHYGASHVGSSLGLSAANVGELVFQNATYGIIRTNGPTPILFGYNSIRRMRLMTGLNVGGDTDPGAGCIEATDTITAAHFVGDDVTLAGDLASQDIVAGGSITVAGALIAQSTLSTASNIACAGNCVVSGFILGSGNVNFPALPTSDPGVVGRLWRSGADVKVSI